MSVWLGTGKRSARRVLRGRRDEIGVALVMVVLVLSALAIIGTPFVVSMVLHDRSSKNFSGEVEARLAAESYRNHALAQLENSHVSVEWEDEKDELEEEREDGGTRRTSLLGGRNKPGSRKSTGRRSGNTQRRSLIGRGSKGGRSKRDDERVLESSAKGPSKASFDGDDERNISFPTSVSLPGDAPPDPNAAEDGVVSFRDPKGITASVEVFDEQGKIHLDTAPPNLIANIFGVSRLAKKLDRSDDILYLEDGTQFRGDGDKDTLDGAVVIVHPKTGLPEVVTYHTKGADQLGGLFRGAFFSITPTEGHPAGSFVYDLKGWKVGFHRYWSPKLGGFHPKALGEFRSVEGMREIAHWQIASLFLNRFRGGGLSKSVLDAAKVRGSKLRDMGLDASMLDGEVDRMDVRQIRDYQRATSALRKLRFDSKLLKRLESRRGPYVVLELAARLRGAKRKEVKKVENEIEDSLDEEAKSRKKINIDPKYARRVLEHMGRVYQVAGIETILPEDLEYHRDAFTVHSVRDARWSEPQALIGDASAAASKSSLAVPRASDFNPGTIVRIRRHDARDRSEYNVVRASGGADTGQIELRYPLRASYRAYTATVEAMERHPINVNSATRKVLGAVFTGVQGRDRKAVVTPYEADRLAARVVDARPLRGHEDFYDLLVGAASSNVIDSEDVKSLFVNAVQPSNYFLRNATTGFSYATADVYTIESRAILRSPAGKEIAQARFREIVDSCPAGIRQGGLISQVDFSDGIYLEDPENTPRFPENNHQYRLRFPGRLSHLMQTRPLLLHRELRVFPGADLSSLRLFPSETPRNSLVKYTFEEVERF